MVKVVSEANKEAIRAANKARAERRSQSEAGAIVIRDQKRTYRIFRLDETNIVVDFGTGESNYHYYSDLELVFRVLYRRMLDSPDRNTLAKVLQGAHEAEERIVAAVKGLKL